MTTASSAPGPRRSRHPRGAANPARRRRVAFRVLVTWAALVAVLVSVVGAAFVAPSAQAAVPAPTATTAVVNVNVGGDRLTSGTGVASVAPLAGVTLGLFTAQTGGTQIGTCVSDAAGDCSFVVAAPNLGTRPWIRGISAPAGWALNDPVRIGGSAGPTTITPYSFQTPTLVANNTYETGNTYGGVYFMSLTGITQYATQSSGIWQLRRDNPPLPAAKCGLDIALVLDMSGSLNVTGQFANMIGAANTIVDAMVGTPTRIATFSYGTRSPHNPPVTNFPALTSVLTQAGANTVKAQYATGNSSGGTNWDEAFWNVAQATEHYDLVINLTDGNPTVHSTGVGDDPDNDFVDLEYAVFSANKLKAELTRIIGVGVGTAIETPQNLIATSGPTAGSDFFQTSDYPAAAAAIVALASAGCPTLKLQKSFPDGRVSANDQVFLRMTTGATQVGTTGTTTGTEVGVQDQAAAEMAGPVRATTGTSYTITETMAAGSTSTLAAYTSTWQCVVGTTVVASGTGATGTFTFPDLMTANPNNVVCTFTNRLPAPTWTIAKTATVGGVPAPGGVVHAGDVITYTVTATNTGTTAVSNVVLTDNLTAVLDNATFVSGSATLTIGSGTPAAVPNPTAGILTTAPFTLPTGTSPANRATLTYRVTVKADQWLQTLTNVVTGTGGPGNNTPPTNCYPSQSPVASTCTTTHTTNAMFQVEKIGESGAGTWVRMDGSTFAVRSDVAGAPGPVLTQYPVSQVSVGLFQVSDIPVGTYWLTELTAPAGFSLLAQPVKVTIAANGSVTVVANSGGAVTALGQLVTVRDVPALVMPATGGTGTTPYLVIGLLLLLAAGGLVLVQRHRSSGPSPSEARDEQT